MMSNATKFEEINFLWNYQIKEMYLRYFAWQFIGKEDYDSRSWDLVTLKGDLIKKLRGIDWSRYGLPFPFLFGLIGMIFHFSRDWKRALAVLALFLATVVFLTLTLIHFSGKNFERLGDVMQAAALVFNDKSLYLAEFKKVISLFLALSSDSLHIFFKLG